MDNLRKIIYLIVIMCVLIGMFYLFIYILPIVLIGILAYYIYYKFFRKKKVYSKGTNKEVGPVIIDMEED